MSENLFQLGSLENVWHQVSEMIVELLIMMMSFHLDIVRLTLKVLRAEYRTLRHHGAFSKIGNWNITLQYKRSSIQEINPHLS